MILDLKDLIQTLAIGLSAILYLLCFLYFLVAEPSKLYGRFFEVIDKDRKRLFFQGVLFAVTYIFGILIEDLSKNTVSSKHPELPIMAYFFPTEKESRMITLFDQLKDDGLHMRVTQLGSNLFTFQSDYLPLTKLYRDTVFEHMATTNFANINLRSDVCTDFKTGCRQNHICRQKIADFSNRLYYLCKNIVYINDNYFAELSQISERIQFSLAIAFVSILFLFSMLILPLIHFIFSIISTRTRREYGIRHQLKTAKNRFSYVLLILFGYFIFLFGRMGYESEIRRYNQRVFGYGYTTLCGLDEKGQDGSATVNF